MTDKLSLSSEVFTRGVEDIIGADRLSALLAEGGTLKIKLGIDATAPFLHIGHATILWKLRALQVAGHKVELLLGDFTTRIGDPTGRSKTRLTISLKEIEANAKRIKEQVKTILLSNARVLEFRKNSEWFAKMGTSDFLEILSMVTRARLIERDMFKERVKRGEEIYMHEFLYPVLQGYDSVMLKSDCTIVGSDQLFNESMGRFLQEKFGSPPQAIVTLQLLPGLDGKEKMSKSSNNYIALLDSPREKFGKAMSLPDSLIIDYLTVYTDVPLPEIVTWKEKLTRGENPMNAKLFFAEALVKRYHGGTAAKKERDIFLSLFSKKEMPDGISPLHIAPGEYDGLRLLMATGVPPSKSEARRLLRERAVEVSGEVLSGGTIRVKSGDVIRVGKKKFFKIA